MRHYIVCWDEKMSNFFLSPITIIVSPSSIMWSDDGLTMVLLSFLITQTMIKSYRHEIEPRGCNAIFDRYYPSELAYAETMRGYDPWSGNSFHILETAINRVVVVWRVRVSAYKRRIRCVCIFILMGVS